MMRHRRTLLPPRIKPLILKLEHYTISARWPDMAEKPQSIKIHKDTFFSALRSSQTNSFETGGEEQCCRIGVLARLLTTGLLAMIIGGLLLSSEWASHDQALSEASHYSPAGNDAARARRTRLSRRHGKNTTRNAGQRHRFETDCGSGATPSHRVAVRLGRDRRILRCRKC
jgi:hypothetical protein